MKFFAPIIALVAVAAATTTPAPTCQTSGAQCCQNVSNSNNAATAALVKSVLGINVSGLNVPIGTGCTPISVAGGVSCNSNTVICGNYYGNALIAINCVPIIINA